VNYLKYKLENSLIELIFKIKVNIEKNKRIVLYSLNMNTLFMYFNYKRFRLIFNSADIIRFDGIAAIIWAKILGFSKKIEQIGADQLMKRLFGECENNRWSVYVLGGSKKTELSFTKNVKKEYPNVIILGHNNGYFSVEEEKLIIEEINNLSPDILLVGLSVPYEQEWVFKNKKKINTKVIITCGGYIEQTSSSGVNYYPYDWINRFHLNWLYRIYKEPKRLWRRYFIQGIWYMFWLPKQIIYKYFKIQK